MYNKLKEIRTERGMSVTELARRTNLSRLTITNIEKGLSNPTVTTVLSISNVLNKNPHDIFFTQNVNRDVQEDKGGLHND